jgi:hypothetical protein
MNPICVVSQAPRTGSSSLLFGTWRGLIFASAALHRSIFIADAHRDDGNRYVVRADEKLTALLELESACSQRTSFAKGSTER